jgi:hypothetical protein
MNLPCISALEKVFVRNAASGKPVVAVSLAVLLIDCVV